MSNSENDLKNENVLLEKNYLKLERTWNSFFDKLKIRNFKNEKIILKNYFKHSKTLESKTLKYFKYLNELKNKKYRIFFKELKKVLQTKNHKKYNFKKLKSLFKGSEGTPFNYLVFTKIICSKIKHT